MNVEPPTEVEKVSYNADSQVVPLRGSNPVSLGWGPGICICRALCTVLGEGPGLRLEKHCKETLKGWDMFQYDCDSGLSIVQNSLDVATDCGLQKFYPPQFFSTHESLKEKKKKK